MNAIEHNKRLVSGSYALSNLSRFVAPADRRDVGRQAVTSSLLCLKIDLYQSGGPMSVVYYIVLDNDVPGFDTFVNGKFVAHENGLEELCKNLNLKTFEAFLTMSEDDLSDVLGEDIELPEVEGEQWFTPEEGLAWISALVAHIKANPTSVSEPQGCLEDLAEYIDVLEKAKSIGAKWHLKLDI